MRNFCLVSGFIVSNKGPLDTDMWNLGHSWITEFMILLIVAPCIFEIYAVHTPTNALIINLVKSFKFPSKYKIISLLRVSVFNDHNKRALSVPNWSYIYVKTLGKITSLCIYIYIYNIQRHVCCVQCRMRPSLTLHYTQHTCRCLTPHYTQHTCRCLTLHYTQNTCRSTTCCHII